MAEARYTITATDKTSRAMRSVRSQMTHLKREVFNLRNATIALASAAAMGALIKKAANLGDSIDKASAVAGLGAEEFQELRFAFGQLADVTDQQVDVALQKFNRRMGLAVDGTGAAKDTFDEMNVSLRDNQGRLRDTDVVLDEVLQSLAGMENDARRAGKASEFFGEETGPKLAAALAGGIQNMDEMRRKAQELGIVIGEDLTERAAELNDKFDILQRQITAEFTETVLRNADAIEELADASRTLISTIGDGIGNVVGFTKWIGEELAAAVGGVAADDIPRLEQKLADVETRLQRMRQVRENSIVEVKPEQEKALEREAARLREQIAFARELEQSAQRRREQNEKVADSEEAVRDAAERAERSMMQMFAGPREAGDLTIDQMTLLRDRTQDLQRAAEEGQSGITAMFAGPRAAGDLTIEQMEILADRQKEAGQAAQDLGFTFSSAFEDAVLQGEKLRDVLQGLAKDIARIVLRKTVTEPLGNAIAGAVSGAFSGARAEGGPVTAGQSYLVGERGPELFSPNRSGQIVSNDRLRSGGSNVTQHITIDAKGADKAAVVRLEQAISQLAQSVPGMAVNAVREADARG